MLTNNSKCDRATAIRQKIDDKEPVSAGDIEVLHDYDIEVLEINMDRRDIGINTYIDYRNHYNNLKKELREQGLIV